MLQVMEFKPCFVLADDKLNQLLNTQMWKERGKKSMETNYTFGLHTAEIGLL
jgi:hypothetical protein